MTKIYLLVPYNYEYDDQWYTQEGYGEPKAGFATRELAETARWTAEMSALNDIDNISEYAYEGLSGVTASGELDLDVINPKLEAMGFDPIEEDNDFDWEIPGLETPEQAQAILAIFPGLSMYSIMELDIQEVPVGQPLPSLPQ